MKTYQQFKRKYKKLRSNLLLNHTFIISICIWISVGCVGCISSLNNLKFGESIVLTNDSHDSWLDWSPDGSKIAFISARSGSNNIYYISLNEIRLEQVSKDTKDQEIYIPKSGAVISQVTNFMRDNISYPAWSIDGKHILFVRTEKIISGGKKEWHSRLESISIAFNEVTKYKINNVEYGRWYGNDKILLLKENDKLRLYIYFVKSENTEIFYKSTSQIVGFNISNSEIIISERDGIIVCDIAGNIIDKFRGLRSLTEADKSNELIAITMEGPRIGIFDVESKKMLPFPQSYSYHPAFSPNGKHLAYISESSGGIVISKPK